MFPSDLVSPVGPRVVTGRSCSVSPSWRGVRGVRGDLQSRGLQLVVSLDWAQHCQPDCTHSWTTVGPQLDHRAARAQRNISPFFLLFNVWESESLLGVVTTVTFRGLVDGNISPILASRCSVIRQWHYSVLSTPHHESYYPGPGPLPGPAAAPHHHHRSHRGWHRQVRDQFTESEVENEITPCVVPGNYAMQQAITQLDEVWCDYKHDQAATK